jgi:hypothetical protein
VRTFEIAFAALIGCCIAFSPFGRGANGASLTCVRSVEIGKVLQEPFSGALLKRLSDQGFSRPGHALCATIRLTGPIRNGDADNIEALIRSNLPLPSRLQLNSSGGDLSEAMKIGRVARRYLMITEPPATLDDGQPYFAGDVEPVAGGICASACFFAWVGGVTRFAGVLGIHRPFPPVAEMQKLSPAEAERVYSEISQSILAYLAEMGTSAHWLTDMMKIPSGQLYIIPRERVDDEDIPSFAQWKFSLSAALAGMKWLRH